MMWLMGLWACNSETETSDLSGKELLDAYHSALCEWYSDRDCAVEISNCGQPVTQFSDWAQCMNAQNNRTSLCGQLPARIEESPDDIQACTDTILNTTCTTDNVCGTGNHLLFEGLCGNVEEMILQECAPF